MTPYPYPVGALVAGADCVGKAFTGEVTEIMGPYMVRLDGIYATPVELINGVLQKPERATESEGSFWGSAPADDLSDLIDDAPAPAGQLGLF